MLTAISTIAALGLALLGLFKKTPLKTEEEQDAEIDNETQNENKTGRPDPKFFSSRGL